VGTAQAQSPQQKPLEKAPTGLETLINRLQGRDMPEGIAKSNDRIDVRDQEQRATPIATCPERRP
jgi:HlyD family secretion protein